MITKPTDLELAGLELILKWIGPRECKELTGLPCGRILGDDCDACNKLDAAACLIRETIERSKPPAPWTNEQKAALVEVAEALQKSIQKPALPGEARKE